MADQHIEPHKVTKPIQLLAAWMVGLILTNTTFLVAATQLSSDDWERGALVAASIFNVPLFLVALFVLQTKFRAELQEDTYYSEYLSKKTSTLVRLDKNVVQDNRLEELERAVVQLKAIGTDGNDKQSAESTRLDWSGWPVALNGLHPRFDEVRESLRSAEIPLSEIFGDDQEDPPSRWIVSLSNSLPATHKAAVLRAVLPYDFDGFQFWDPIRDADETEDVYIGSYGDKSYARIDDDLSKLLQRSVEDSDLRRYYSKHRVIPLVKPK